MNKTLIRAVSLHPEVLPFLNLSTRAAYYKAAPMTRDELEKKVTRAIYNVDKEYLSELQARGIYISPDFWTTYERNLRDAITPLFRQYTESTFATSSDYANIADRDKVLDDMDAKTTASVAAVVAGVALSTRAKLAELIASGISQDEVIERIAFRFGNGHAEQVAITEITTLEGDFAEALSNRLIEQGVKTVTRIYTAEDERVCPVCGPADHKLYDQPINTANGGWNGQSWQSRFGPKGAHARCRCQRIVELPK